MGLLVTAFALVLVVTSVPIARWVKNIPRRHLLATSMSMWALGASLIALSHGLTELFAGRIIMAVGQAVFWVVAMATAADLFPAAVRGQVVARLMFGTSLAGVAGLPLSIWWAHATSWRAPFFGLAAVGLALAIAIAITLPTYAPCDGGADHAPAPSQRIFVRVLCIEALVVTGWIVVYTYITPYLTDVAGLSPGVVPLVLGTASASGVVGMWTVGRCVNHAPRQTMTVGVGLMALAWGALAIAGSVPLVAWGAMALFGLAWSITVATMLTRTARHAPGRTDMGAALYSTTFNAGAMVGSLAGAAVFASLGLSWLPVAGAVLVAAAAVVVITEPRVRT